LTSNDCDIRRFATTPRTNEDIMKKKAIAEAIENMGSGFLIDAIALIDHYLTHHVRYTPEQNCLMRGIGEMKINELVMTRKAITDQMLVRDVAAMDARSRRNAAVQSTPKMNIKERLRQFYAQHNYAACVPKPPPRNGASFTREDKALFRDLLERLTKTEASWCPPPDDAKHDHFR
jgi:hypothetical protein